MKGIEMTIQNEGRTIYGVKYTSNQSKPSPLVIVSHGYNGTHESADQLGQYLSDHGISVFCYDFCGGSVNSRSSMNTTEMTIFTEEEDLVNVIGAAKTWDDVDPDNLFLFGESQGGLVTALVAEQYKEDIQGVLLLYPALCIPDDWDRKFPNLCDIPDEFEFWGMVLGRKFFETIHGYPVFEHIGGYDRNVQIFYGIEDPIVPQEYVQKAADTYPHAQLELFPGEGHGFSTEGCRRLVTMTYDFVQKNRK